MRIHPTHEDLAELTAGWTGERSDDGRPQVSDGLLKQLREVSTEQAWSVLREGGFDRQFAGGWQQTRPGRILVGRAVTAQFLPHRPDLDAAVVAAGAREQHSAGDRQNSWVIESLTGGDVMVADIFGKVRHGTVIGDNLGTAIGSRTGAGAVIDGGIRDFQGLVELDNADFFFRAVDPTPIRDVTLAGINLPIRIGEATVLPGDIVLGTPSGVIFIPPHLAQQVVDTAEDIRVRDVFGKLRLSERTYTSDEIDVAVWADPIEADFQQWKQRTR
jgi:regulator of RNase E activity RraA